MASSRVFFAALLLAALAIWSAPASAADQAPDRLALVIGNGEYQSAPLKNPPNDAADMAAMLREMGFTVIMRINADQRDMEEAIREFQSKLGQESVGLFFFAGHGMQVGGVNYLIPVGAKIGQESDVKFESVDAGRVLAAMDNAHNRLNIVVLDACRDNPFARSFRSAQKGLARMDAPTGTFIAYATAPGDTASDGDGRNGVFTKYMLEYMPMPNLEVDKVMKKVRVSVMRETDKRQVPWQSSSLTGDFYFRGGGGEKQQDQGLTEEWARISKERREVAELKRQLGDTLRRQAANTAYPSLPGGPQAPAASVAVAAEDLAEVTIMALIQEKCVQCGVQDMELAETELVGALTATGYTVVDKAQLELAGDKDQARMALAGNAKAAASLASRLGAQYVLMGVATVHDAGEAVPGTGLHSIQTTLQLRLLDARTGKVLGSFVERAVAAHISQLTGASQALQQAARRAVGGPVTAAVASTLKKASQLGAELRLFVTGVKDLATYSALSKMLEATPGISGLKKLNWNQASGLVVLDLRFSGSSEDLAVALDEKRLGRAKVSVRDFGAGQLDIRII
ncbi:MAG: caspase family protein [Desulfovibrionaceae bacterium]|nr:caspase family protein [Desulfovibrionaceae bacterium]